jgi:transcriptional regulator NrdR family protein
MSTPSNKRTKADSILFHLRNALNIHQVMQEDLDLLISNASKQLAGEIGTSISTAHKLLELVLDKEVELNKRRARPISSVEIEALINKHLHNEREDY